MTLNQNHEEKSSEGCAAELTSLVLGELGSHMKSFSIEAIEQGLILRGNCDSFHTKQMVQEIVGKNTSFRIYSNNLVVIET